jgi:predicted  nucleic acid-binding Zn-ribbon protein
MGIMTDEQKKIYESYFGVPFEEITVEERRAFEETIKYKFEALVDALKPIVKKIADFFKGIAKALLAWKKDVDQRAEAGEPDAQYVRLSIDLMSIDYHIEETEKKLRVTKKSNARRPLLDYQKRLKSEREEVKQQLIDVGKALQEERGAK